MEQRTFQAREIREALALVRRELGPDAVILQTRRIPGPAFGLLGGSLIEVTAAAPHVEAPAPAPAKPAKSVDDRPIRALLAGRRADRERTREPKPSVAAMIEGDPGAAVAAASGAAGPAPHAALRRRLLAAMVPRDLCERWLRDLGAVGNDVAARADAEARLRAILHDTLGKSSGLAPAGRRVVALVGPSGVGKTTTLAKIAASMNLVAGKRVAIVSLDDGRLGATSALRGYAKLLDVPFTSVPGSGLAQAIAAAGDAELVLVDTAGISPAQPAAFEELGRRLARAGEPVFVHLCVAAATRAEELERIAHLYRPLEPGAVLVTKVDEAVAIGSVLGLRARSSLPFSFVTTGPQVPDDLVQANPDVLIDLLLGGARA
jgi:flagellar biosynthesis protein FlhF